MFVAFLFSKLSSNYTLVRVTFKKNTLYVLTVYLKTNFVVTSEHCNWKKPAYFSLMFEVMWKYTKEGICE